MSPRGLHAPFDVMGVACVVERVNMVRLNGHCEGERLIIIPVHGLTAVCWGWAIIK
jgi:hypothetical protein